MKKIVSLLILFTLISFPVSSRMIVIDTPYEREVKLFIPEDHDALEEFYIDLAMLYYEQRYDLERSVENVDKLLTEIEVLTDSIMVYRETLENIIVLLTDVQFYPRSFDVGVGFNFELLKPTYHLSLTYMLSDRFQVGFGLEYPFSVRGFVGIRY